MEQIERTTTRVKRALALGALSTGAVGFFFPPFRPPPPPRPPATTTTTPTTAAGKPKIEIQGDDPIVLVSGLTAQTRTVTIKNVGTANDTGGFTIQISGSAPVSVRTGTCSRPLKAGATCDLLLGLRANARAGRATLTVGGGPKAGKDTATVVVELPEA